MAGNVDTRVVELQFQNREFERNIAQSQKSIEDLKEAMDFDETSRGLEKFTSSFDFSRMESNLQRLTDKFTGFGNAAEFVISRIRRTIEGAAVSLESFIKSISSVQIPVGQGKYDALNKSVMSIVSGGKATEDQAYQTMERVMEYTNQTSHSFDTMVTMISNLTSIGIPLQQAELLLEGMGNAATFAGKGAMEAANSMSILTKSMNPSGFLGYEKFLSLSQTAGVVTDKWRQQALEAAEAVGTLKKKNDKFYVSVKGQKAIEVTAENLENTLRYRWLTGQALQKLYENYQFANSGDWEKDLKDLQHPQEAVDSFGKTAYLTGQRALTLADAINAVKESVSSGWMETFRNLFGDVTEAAEHFTNIADRLIEFVEKVADFRNGVLSRFASQGGRTKLMELFLGDYEKEIEEGKVGILDLLEGAGGVISKAFWDFIRIFHPASLMDEAFNQKWENNPGYRRFWLSDMLMQGIESIQEFFASVKKFFSEEIIVNGQVTTRLQMIREVVQGLSGVLSLALDIMTTAFDFVNQIGKDLDPSISAIMGLFADLGVSIFETAKDTREGKKINNFFSELRTNLEPITTGVNNVILSFVKLIRLITGLDKEDKDKGEGAFSKLGKALLDIVKVMANVIGPILNFISKVIDAFSVFDKGFNKETIGEFFTQVGEALRDSMKQLADSMPEGLKFIRDFIYDLFGLWDDKEKYEERVHTFGTFLRKIFEQGLGGFNELISSVFGGFSLSRALETGFGFTSAFNFLKGIANAFKNVNLYTVLMGFLGVATVGGIFSLVMNLRKAVRTIGGFFEDAGKNFVSSAMGRYEWFSEKLVSIAKAIGVFALVIMGLGSMDTGKLVQGVLALAACLGMVMFIWWYLERESSQAKSSLPQQLVMETMIAIITAAVIGICAGLSVLILSVSYLASNPVRMITALVGIAALLAMFGFFIKIMLDQLKSFTFKIGMTKQWQGIGMMAIMLFSIAGAIALLGKGMSILLVAVTPLAALGWEAMARAVIAIGAILTMFGLFINIMLKTLDNFAFGLGGRTDIKSISKMALMLLALSGSILLLAAGIGLVVLAITPLSLMSWGGFVRAIAGLGIILLELGIFIKYIQGLSTNDKSISVKIAGLAGFAIALGILVSALMPLALMSWGGWARSMLGLGVVLAEIIGFMALFRKLGLSTKAMKFEGLIGFTVAIAVLMAALKPIAMLDWGQWARAMLGLGVVLLEIIGFMKLFEILGLSTKALKFEGLIGFAIGLAILMYSLKFVGELDDQQYLRGIVGLATVMAMIIVLLAVIKEMRPDLKSAGSTMLLLIALGASLILFSIAFNEIKDVPTEKIAVFGAALVALILAVAYGGKVANAIGIKGIIMLALGIAAILGVIALMAPLLIKSIAGGLTEAAGQLSLMATLLQDFTGKMNNVSTTSMDNAKKIIGMVGEILGLIKDFIFYGSAFESFSSAVGQLLIAGDMLKDMTGRFNAVKSTHMDHARSTIEKIKAWFDDGILDFDGAMAKAKNFSDIMYQLGTGITMFNDGAAGFEMDPEDNPAIKTIQALAGCSDQLDTIAKMNLDDLTSKISGLGGAMMLYAQGAKEATGLTFGDTENGGPDPKDVDAAVALLQAISESIGRNGGVVVPQNLPDEGSIGLFGAQLAALAGALIRFEEAGKGLGDGTDKALETLKFFEDLKVRLEETHFKDNIGAIDSFGTGDEAKNKASELETFGKNISQLAISMGKFANSTTYIDEETKEVKTFDYTRATTAIEKIAEVSNSLPVIDQSMGEVIRERESLSDFAGEIEKLGSALGYLHQKTTQVNGASGKYTEFNFDNAVTAVERFAAAANSLPNYGGIKSLWNGSKMNLTELGGHIEALGGAMNDFAMKVNGDGTKEHPGFDVNALDTATKTVNTMVDMLNRLKTGLSNVGGIGNWFSSIWSGRSFDFTDLSKQLESLGGGIGKLGEGLDIGKWSDEGAVTAMINALGALNLLLETIYAMSKLYDTTELGIGFQGSILADDLVTFLDTITVNTDLIGKMGQLMSAISDEFKEWGDIDVSKANIFMLLAESIRALSQVDADKTYDWVVVGASIATGVAQGIKDNTTIVTKAAIEMATETYKKTMEALEASSPSRLFTRVGSYVGLGFANGIYNTTDGAVDAATGMTDETIAVAMELLEAINRILSDGAEAEPTITPVLDLTNIENGASKIGGLLGNGYGLTLNGSSLNIRLDGNANVENQKDYTDSLSRANQEIASLREDVQTLATAMSNLKLVMNTGAVVGAIGPEMDQYLGQRGFYTSRTET